MTKFYIDYQTGAGNETVEGTLDDAMATAENGIAYTQQNVNIYDIDELDAPAATLPWYGVAATEDDEVTADYSIRRTNLFK